MARRVEQALECKWKVSRGHRKFAMHLCEGIDAKPRSVAYVPSSGVCAVKGLPFFRIGIKGKFCLKSNIDLCFWIIFVFFFSKNYSKYCELWFYDITFLIQLFDFYLQTKCCS